MVFSESISYSDTELLSFLVSEKKAVKLMEKYGTVREIWSEGYESLKANAGLTLREYSRIKAPYCLMRRENKEIVGKIIQQPIDVVDYFKYFGLDEVEQFIVLGLDIKNKIIFEKVISVGTINSTLVDPKVIFSLAVRKLSSGLIFIHNHPSGLPAASNDDIEITKTLDACGKLLGIHVLDHIIIGREQKYFSMKEASLL